MLATAVLTILAAGAFDAQAQQAIKNGDVLTGQLNAMSSRANAQCLEIVSCHEVSFSA